MGGNDGQDDGRIDLARVAVFEGTLCQDLDRLVAGEIALLIQPASAAIVEPELVGAQL